MIEISTKNCLKCWGVSKFARQPWQRCATSCGCTHRALMASPPPLLWVRNCGSRQNSPLISPCRGKSAKKGHEKPVWLCRPPCGTPSRPWFRFFAIITFSVYNNKFIKNSRMPAGCWKLLRFRGGSCPEKRARRRFWSNTAQKNWSGVRGGEAGGWNWFHFLI